MKLADIHCHLVPYVDDGAAVLKEAEKLIGIEYEQGVRVICMTPHLREGMFETPDEEIIRQFTRIRELIEEKYQDSLQVFLSREYHYDALYKELLSEGGFIPMGNGRWILTEFSSYHSAQMILKAVETIRESGLRPLVAHVERYPSVREDLELLKQIRKAGGAIQMNASSILGREGPAQKRFCKKALSEKLVDVVASDAHDSVDRPPELKEAYEQISKKFGEDYAEKIFWINPLRLLKITSEI